jgi:simple sugar transport system permease protein
MTQKTDDKKDKRKTQDAEWHWRITRKRVLAAGLLLLALILGLHTQQAITAGMTTTLTLEAGADDVAAIVVPTLYYMYVILSLFVIGGLLGLVDPPQIRRETNIIMIIAGLLFIPTIFVVAAAGGRTNIITMLTESLRLATPIAIGAMAGLWCERTGVINIAIEGMMLFSACISFAALYFILQILPPDQTGLAFLLAVMVGVLSGGIIALLHAWLSITFAVDQIVSGTVINILALGSTSFIRREYLLAADGGLRTLPAVRIPLLADIPIVGEALFNNKPIFYMMFVVIIVSHIVLFHTKWGLRTRSVGENPHAADTLGIKVNWMRWINVFIGGLIAGLAGAWFTIELAGSFTDNMTDGKGFIALAALIFGKWTPFGAFGGALVFGFSEALGTRLQILDFSMFGVATPPQFLQMVPYVVTLVVLAGFVGRAIPPKAIGKPYQKE